MRKEVVIAIILGSFLGIFLAFILSQRAVKSRTRSQQATTVETSTSNSTTPNTTQATLQNEIASGELGLSTPAVNTPIHTAAKLTGSNANDSAYLLIFADGGEHIYRTEAPTFSASMTLSPGILPIELVNVSQSGAISRKTQTVLVTTLPSDVSTGSKSSYGVITDITEGALQMRTNGGAVEQITTTGSTIYKNVVKDVKDIKSTDLAIGDFVGTVGTTSGRGVITAQEILVDTPETSTPSAVVKGVVAAVTTKLLTLNAQNEEVVIPLAGKALRRLGADNLLVRIVNSAFKVDSVVLATDKYIYLLP